MLDCYKWEADALFKGRLLAQVDEREHLVELAWNLRYSLNADKPKPHKMFNKKKEIANVDNMLSDKKPTKVKNINFAQKVQIANDHFKNKYKAKESE